MADWTNVLDSAQDPDAPITSEWGYAMRDNPIAIAEGAVGAPRIQSDAFQITAGSITGVLAFPPYSAFLTATQESEKYVFTTRGTARFYIPTTTGTTQYSIIRNGSTIGTITDNNGLNQVYNINRNDVYWIRLLSGGTGKTFSNVSWRITEPVMCGYVKS